MIHAFLTLSDKQKAFKSSEIAFMSGLFSLQASLVHCDGKRGPLSEHKNTQETNLSHRYTGSDAQDIKTHNLGTMLNQLCCL